MEEEEVIDTNEKTGDVRDGSILGNMVQEVTMRLS